MFTIKDRMYTLIHNHPEYHLKDQNGQVILNAGDFRDDLKSATKKIFDEVEIYPTLLENVHRRFTNDGFLNLVFLSSP